MAQQPKGVVTVSSDWKDYTSMILYLKQNNEICDQLLEIASNYTDVQVMFVEKLERKPEWLTGVPTLVDTKTYEIYTGTDAISALRSHRSTEPIAVNSYGDSGSCLLDSFDYKACEKVDQNPLSLEEMMRRRGQ
jgi:hypothetical protein